MVESMSEEQGQFANILIASGASKELASQIAAQTKVGHDNGRVTFEYPVMDDKGNFLSGRDEAVDMVQKFAGHQPGIRAGDVMVTHGDGTNVIDFDETAFSIARMGAALHQSREPSAPAAPSHEGPGTLPRVPRPNAAAREA